MVSSVFLLSIPEQESGPEVTDRLERGAAQQHAATDERRVTVAAFRRLTPAPLAVER